VTSVSILSQAGKSYTMIGDPSNQKSKGICWHIIRDILNFSNQDQKSVKYLFTLSFFEIYNEHVFDLLGNSKENLMVIED
jgi:hypothetical protein